MNIRRLGTISLGHMALDIMASSIAMILTAVAGKFELSVGQIGLGAMVVMFSSSLTQPFFGAWADRLRGRWLGPVGLLWYAFFFALIPFSSSYGILLTLLTIGSLGSAAVHTAGMVISPDAGGDHPTTATSIFFVFGQTGLSIGPVISGFILRYWGLEGLPFVALAVVPVGIMMFLFLQEPVRYAELELTDQYDGEKNTPATNSNPGWFVVSVFVALILLRSTTAHTYMTFLPKYFEDLGYTSDIYGLMVGIFVFGGAMGTFVGGFLGDRFNRRLVIFTSLVVSIPFCLLLLGSSGLLFYVSAALAGALLNTSHSIIIVIGQALLPRQKGMMSGATLGFMFASGSLTAWLAGLTADIVGLPTVMYALAIVPLAGALVALLLPGTRQSELDIAMTSTAAGD